MSIIKTDLVTQFGSHYIPEGQNESRLLTALRQKTVTTMYAKPIIYDGEVYRFANTTLGEIVQQFQKKFTAKGDLTFKPNKITLRNLKIDVSLYPDEVNGSWMGFLGSVTLEERKNWPIVRFLLEKEVIPQIQNDLELKAYFKGEHTDATSNTAGTSAGSIDGVKKLLDAGMTGSTPSMNVVTLSSSVTSSNAFDLVEEFVDSFDQNLSGTKMRLYMDPKILRQYLRDKRGTHGADINYSADKLMVDFSMCELVGLPSMSGQKYFWATPLDNFLHIRRVGGMNAPRVEEALRQVHLMADWWEGLGFGYDKLVYVSKWT